ncbi:MAG: hypothetical protein M3011_03975 [Actinomycetota bacterium]|nr:hypothetical protein [Actinomycetota bacterium]
MVSDSNRHDLYVALEHQLGQGPTETLMQLLPPVGWADVARASDLEALGIALRGEMAELRVELRGEMAELRGEMAEPRGEIKAQLPRLYAANVASMIGVAGLVLAAAKLA